MARHVWKLAKPLLEPAFDEACDDTIVSIEENVIAGTALLWLASEGPKIIAAATTIVNKTPRHKVCIVHSAGGLHSRLWDQFMPMVENYARKEGCSRVRVAGREGWARVLMGYAQPWIVLDKVI